MLHHAGRHMDGVAGPYGLLLHLATCGFPLHHTLPAEYEINLLEVCGVFDFDVLCPVFVMPVPMVRAEPRTDFIYVEKKRLRGNDAFDLPGFFTKAAYVLRLHVVGFDDVELCH